jgi:hypothetical protein
MFLLVTELTFSVIKNVKSVAEIVLFVTKLTFSLTKIVLSVMENVLLVTEVPFSITELVPSVAEIPVYMVEKILFIAKDRNFWQNRSKNVSKMGNAVGGIAGFDGRAAARPLTGFRRDAENDRRVACATHLQ